MMEDLGDELTQMSLSKDKEPRHDEPQAELLSSGRPSIGGGRVSSRSSSRSVSPTFVLGPAPHSRFDNLHLGLALQDHQLLDYHLRQARRAEA